MCGTSRCFGLLILIANGAWAGPMADNNANQFPMAPEARSLLDVISRVAPVRARMDSQNEGGLGVALCFDNDQAFGVLRRPLSRFRGNFRWVLGARLPYVCLTPIPGVTPPGAAMTSIVNISHQILGDMASLATFIEIELDLKNVRSKGITILQQLSSPLEPGPGGPAYLVAEPDRYVLRGFLPTSDRDRTVDSWMSDDELQSLYQELRNSTVRFALLHRISESSDENVIVLPQEVEDLKRECEEMANVSGGLRLAMMRLRRICDIALSARLGIVVLGG
jgi:hypothetical protein